MDHSAGEHYVNAAEPVVFKTGGTAFGIVVIPRENTACWLQWDRDDAGTAIDCTGWTMTRGRSCPARQAAP